MARYDLYTLREQAGYLLDVQTDLIDRLQTRVVVPLLPTAVTPPPVRRLNPVFAIGGKRYVMATPLLASVPVADLEQSQANLSMHHDEIVAALDMLFQGF
jgi:toxin CcdB